ncbi:MAG TPA: helix-turn-helix transcriptional regulator [Alphaproteobacteria bacterium]|nr:helix-turn-helix transcriptional regulator [Alphaproteobacteria bacterium]
MTTQFIEEDGKRKYAVIPVEVYERMLEDLEDLEDIRAYDRHKAEPQEFIPAEMAYRMLDGENPIKVWREHRGLTQQALADQVGISKPYLSQIETGKRNPTAKVLRPLAEVLQVDIDDLI